MVAWFASPQYQTAFQSVSRGKDSSKAFEEYYQYLQDNSDYRKRSLRSDAAEASLLRSVNRETSARQWTA